MNHRIITDIADYIFVSRLIKKQKNTVTPNLALLSRVSGNRKPKGMVMIMFRSTCRKKSDKIFHRFCSTGFPVRVRLFQEVEGPGQRQIACQHPHVCIPLSGALFYDAVKELARLTGLTPRTLRYYDAIGLLRPRRGRDNDYPSFPRISFRPSCRFLLLFRTMRAERRGSARPLPFAVPGGGRDAPANLPQSEKNA